MRTIFISPEISFALNTNIAIMIMDKGVIIKNAMPTTFINKVSLFEVFDSIGWNERDCDGIVL
ncbi:hypothetical protein WH221_11155 [Chryseobacterium culicis]|uniref:hypothetical protein n=1 Tax=Chryseobacterium culicis TaxID=680127 RepID=UPI000F4D6A1F|nr:hypothetical protein [Chryseobacterium culicis]